MTMNESKTFTCECRECHKTFESSRPPSDTFNWCEECIKRFEEDHIANEAAKAAKEIRDARSSLDRGVVKIALGQSASAALAGLGPCLVIATMADGTAPEHAHGRMILHCAPITKQAADNAYRVATGQFVATKPRAPKSPKRIPAPSFTPEQIRRA